MTRFHVAASRNYTSSDGERKEETEWFSVVAWRKLAEQCSQFLQKGRKVYVEGRLQTRSWDTPEGQKPLQDRSRRRERAFPRPGRRARAVGG